MFILGSFQATLGIDESDYTRGILDAQAVTTVFGAQVTTFLTNPLLGAIEAMKAAGRWAISMSTEVLGISEQVQKLSDATGVSTDTIQALRGEFQHQIEDFRIGDKVVEEFTKKLGEARTGSLEVAGAFRQLGVDVNAMESADQILARVFDGLVAIEDEAIRTALAGRTLGEESAKMSVRMLSAAQGGLSEITARQREYLQLFDRDRIDKLAAFNTAVGGMGNALEGAKRQLVATGLEAFIDQVGTSEQSILSIVQKITSDLIPAMERVGKLAGQIGDGIKYIDENVQNIRWLFGQDELSDFNRFEAAKRLSQQFSESEVPGIVGRDVTMANLEERRRALRARR